MCGRDAPCARCMNSAQECRSDDGNKWYWQCVPKRTRPAGQATVLARDPVRDPVQPAANAVRPWGQCGGKGHDCARDAACSPCKRHPRNGRQFTCKRGNEWVSFEVSPPREKDEIADTRPEFFFFTVLAVQALTAFCFVNFHFSTFAK